MADPNDDSRPMMTPFSPGLRLAILEDKRSDHREFVAFFDVGIRNAC